MPRPARTVRILVALVLGLVAVPGVAPAPQAAAATWACTADTPVEDRPVLRKGDRGTCVKVVQNLLTTRGYKVKSSGSFDSATDLAVRRFQHDRVGLAIDGAVGRATWTALDSGGTPYDLHRGPHTSDAVLLSFDDCPVSYEAFEETVLGAEQLGIALALLPTGDCVQAGRFDADVARAHGHYVFNHSVTHPYLTELSARKVYAELGSPGIVTSYGRPPFGHYDTETVRNAYAQRGMRIWTWTFDTRDWEGKTTDQVVDVVVGVAGADPAMPGAQAGDTVLMHMKWNAFNPDALARITDGLEGRGLTVCRNQDAPAPVAPDALAC